MRELDRLLGSTAFRLSCAFSALLIAAFVAAGIGVWTSTQSIAEQQARQHIRAEMDFLSQEIAVEGIDAATLAMEHRELRPAALLYRLTSPDRLIHSGDLPEDSVRLGWQFLDIAGHPENSHGENDLIVLSEQLPNGLVLSIGDDLGREESVRASVLHSLIWAGFAAAFLTLIVGVWVTHRSLRRMTALSATLTSIAGGDFTQRAFARAPPRDDLDRLSAGVNAMLDRIALLVTNVRLVSSEVAHDLRTPLSHVRQDLEQATQSASASARSHIEAAQSRIEGLLRTFDAMLGLAELETQSARVRFGMLSLEQVVEAVGSAYQPDVEAEGGSLIVDVAAPFEIEGNADLLKQALANLIENAMVHAGPTSRIKVSCRSTEDAWTLEVSDNGPGIAEQDRAKALAPFGRLDRSGATPGTGLGLAIVAAIAALHGALLSLEDGAPGLRVILRSQRGRVLGAQK